jgi:uncharacterized repeat protein (TIGR03943 family)
MRAKVSNILNACTLIGLGSVFLSFYWSGRIDQYLNPLFRPLVLAGALVTLIIGLSRLLTSAPEHRHHCSEGDCDHQHANGTLRSLVCFALVCIPVLAGGTFSKDAFDPQILASRAPIEDDAEPTGPYVSNASSAGNGLYRVACSVGFIRGQAQKLSSINGNGLASHAPVPVDGTIPVEVTDLLRAETIEPLRNALAGKNVAVVGQFVPGSKENSFKLTRMFIWCCAADARPIHVKVEVPVPVNVPKLQWVKVIGMPEYSTDGDRARLVVKAQSVVPVKPPKDAMLY